MMSLFFTSSLSINLPSNKANNGFTMPLKQYFEKAYWTHERPDATVRQTDVLTNGRTDGRTDNPSSRDASALLKMASSKHYKQ